MNQIAVGQPVGQQELAALGASRAASISAELAATGQIAAQRVRI